MSYVLRHLLPGFSLGLSFSPWRLSWAVWPGAPRRRRPCRGSLSSRRHRHPRRRRRASRSTPGASPRSTRWPGRRSRAGHVPGAVILVGHRGKIVYRKAFGQCALMPRCQPMKVDTIFDIASLTKVVATTTAVMELVERGQIQSRQTRRRLLAGLCRQRQGGDHHPAAPDPHVRVARRGGFPAPLVGL